MDHTASFGYWLRRRRKALDLTQEELGRQAGCTADTIRRIEMDARRPSRQLAERLARCLALNGDERGAFVRAARAELAIDRLEVAAQPIEAIADTWPGGRPTGINALPADVCRDNLPAQPTPFVGREAELATLGELLASPDARLITIVGLGGIGKTRLALAAAERHLHAGPNRTALDGVFFVALGALTSPAQLVSALASGMGLALESSQRQAQQRVLDYLRRKRMLLVLDAFEQVLDGVDLVEQIVRTASDVTVLVTSRERLQLHDEQILVIEGLAVPEREDVPAPESYAAVRLFLQTARQIYHDFAPDDGDMRGIIAICRMVEGLPLAIELAAAWVALLRPAAILAELRRSMDLLASELRDLPPRQRSIRAVCDSAWQRLSAEERAIFARLAVFQGGFTLDGARAVAGAELPELAHLVNYALLRHDHARDRYTIHELLRQYGAEQLARDPAEQAGIHLCHATYFCTLLARHAADLRGARQLAAVEAIGAEEENLHVAWRHAVDSRAVDLLELAADSLGGYYEWQGYLHEGEEAFQVAAAVAPFGDGPDHLQLLARLLAWHGTFCALVGQGADGEAALQQSLGLLGNGVLAARDTRAERAFVLWRLGQLRARGGDAAAIELYEQSLGIYRELGGDGETSAVLSDLGELLCDQGRLDEAERALRESQAICERNGDRRGLARALELCSRAYFEHGQPGEAERLARQCEELCQAIGNYASRAAALRRLGNILMHLSRLDEARVYLARSLELYEDLGDPSMIAFAHSRMGLVLLHLGEFEAARPHAEISVALGRETGGVIFAQALAVLALAEEAAGDIATADALWGEGVAYCQAHGLSGYVGILMGGQAYEAWDLGDRRRSRARAIEALRIAVEKHHLLALGMALPICPLLLLEQGEPVRAAEIYGIDASGPLWHASKLVAITREMVYASICAVLPPEVVAAAEERGRQLDLWTTAAELLDELTAMDEGRAER